MFSNNIGQCANYTEEKIPSSLYEINQQKNKFRFSLVERIAVLILGDVIFLAASIIMTIYSWEIYHKIKYPMNKFTKTPVEFLWLIIPWILISVISDSYNSKTLRHLTYSLKQPLQTTILVWMIYFIIYFLAPLGSLPRVAILFFGILSCILLVLWRYCHFKIFSHRKLREKLMMIGESELTKNIRHLIAANKLYYEIISINTKCPKRKNRDHNYCCSCWEKLKESSKISIDKIIFAPQHLMSQKCLNLLLKCREAGIAITPMPQFYEDLTKRTPIDGIKSWYISFLPLKDAEWGGFYPILKRILDIFFALIGLVCFSILFPFLAIAIKITSHGPIFFSQVRVGKNGKKFKLIKLRSMVIDAEEKGAMWTEDKDKRITLLGKILRKTHIDELPQFINILKGDISVVGVRPLSVKQCEKFERKISFHNLRHLVKPGLTSWAVINFKHVNNLEGAKTRLEYDLYYVKNQSLWLDFLIIFRTIWIIVTMKGL